MTSHRATLSRPPTGPWPVHLALAAAQTGFALFPTLGKLALTSMPPLRTVAAGVLILAGLAVSVARPRLPAEEVA